MIRDSLFALPPAKPAPVLNGVYFDSAKRAGYWKAIVACGSRVQHIKIEGTDQYTCKDEAECLASETKWGLA